MLSQKQVLSCARLCFNPIYSYLLIHKSICLESDHKALLLDTHIYFLHPCDVPFSTELLRKTLK